MQTSRLTIVIIIAVLCAGLIGTVVMWPYLAFDPENMEESFRSLGPDSVDRLLVFDRYGEHLLLVVEERKIIDSFVLGLRSSKPYDPYFPNYVASWRVRLQGSRNIEFVFHFERDHPNGVVGQFATPLRESSVPPGADFISFLLRPWFEEHVQQALDGEDPINGNQTG